MIALLPMLLPLIQSVLGRILPDAGQAAQATAELQKALLEREGELDRVVLEAAKAQIDVNLAEANSESTWKSGWRPFIGWICGVACIYGFLAQPLLAWLTGIVSALAGAAIPVPPVLDMGTLMTLLGGMLGIAGLRTTEKVALRKPVR